MKKCRDPFIKIDILKKGVRLGIRDQALIERISRSILQVMFRSYKSEFEVKRKVYSQLKSSSVVLNILVTSPAGIKRLNRKFRNKDKTTNVLSFSYITDNQDLISLVDESILLGEIILNWNEVLLDSGPEYREKFEALTNLLSHSILHIFGYTHSDKACLKLMESRKKEITSLLSINKSDLMEV